MAEKKLSDLKIMILNAEEENLEKPEETTKETSYTFQDIKDILKNFLGKYYRVYRLSIDFPEMQRISEQIRGQRVADFTPSGVHYYTPKIKGQITNFFKNTKFLEYFEGRVHLK